MSLDRFTNINEIRTTPGLTRGISWPQNSIELLDLDEIKVRPTETPTVEIHIYTPTNEAYLGGGPTTDFRIHNDKIYIDYIKTFADLNIKRGFFKVLINVYYEIIGEYNYPLLQIQDISADSREMLLTVFKPRAGAGESNLGIIEEFLNVHPKALERDFALNFGENEIVRLINYKSYEDPNVLAVRTLTPLPVDLAELSRCNLIEIISDSWIDNISLDQLAPNPTINMLRGPNFEIDSGYTTNTESDFQNWNQLLGSNLNTSDKIVNSFFGGTISGIELGIDYTSFPEFVFYSSAEHRVAGFKSKLESIEFYNERLKLLAATSGSSSGSLSVNITNTTAKLNDVIGQFDTFEQWLYNEPTGSIYTHGTSGSFKYVGIEGARFAVSPYPKKIINGQFVIYPTTASIAETWYDQLNEAAIAYDESNPHNLTKSIPQHIREDANNSEYDIFVNMIGHHFDIIYTYASALTRVHTKEEHPKRGIDKDVLFDVARSQGWQLVNGKQASQLWRYKLGTNEAGAYASTGSIFSQSDEAITGEVWRRIVNNLPYILKTRGTSRSISALLNIYGVPQSLLSIREYGGPMVNDSWPTLTEDRYSYAVLFNSASYITYSTNHISSSIGNWGIPRGKNNVIPVQTREFRFRPNTTGSMLLYSQVNTSTGVPLTHIAIQHTGSYSGSALYGRVHVSFANGTSITPITGSTGWIPLFNGEFWNLRYGWYTSNSHFNSGSNNDTTYNIRVQQASDFIRGKISVTSSIEFTPTDSNQYNVWSHPINTDNGVYIGGYKGTTDSLNVNAGLSTILGTFPGPYSGSMQEYREWLEYLGTDAFDDHTLNPTSYVSYLSPSSSYDTLVRHYTLGTDIIGYNLNVPGTIISSSHPNTKVKDFNTSVPNSSNASAFGFPISADTQRGNFVPVEETYYIRGASLGANNQRSEKIRLEDNSLVRRLSPILSAEVSSFDNAPLDSNKLGLFYSFADQVNKDVFNHIGRIELDDYIGDPDDEYQMVYEDLKHFSSQYWKKFTNNSDINAFNRVFSQFDFSVFNQIKQTLPFRVDDATGLLIEPNILERSKVHLTKPIEVDNPQYDFHIPDVAPPAFGESVTETLALIESFETNIYTPSALFSHELLASTALVRFTGSTNYCTIETLPVDELRSYTSSFIDSNYTVSSSTTTNFGVMKLTYGNQNIIQQPTNTITANFLSSSFSILDKTVWQDGIVIGAAASNLSSSPTSITTGSFTNQIRLKLKTFSSHDMFIQTKIIHKGEASVANSIRYTAVLAFTETDDINSRIIKIIDTQSDFVGIVNSIQDIQFTSFNHTAYKNLILILQYHNAGVTSSTLDIKQITPIITIEKVCHSGLGLQLNDSRKSNIFMKTIYHYSGSLSIPSSYGRNFNQAQNEQVLAYYSQSLVTADYRDDFFESYERQFYIGTQLSAPAINAASTNTALGQTPIIEIYEVNPNQIFYNSTPRQASVGNALDPGRLTIR